MKKLFIPILIMLFLVPFVFAKNNYIQVGNFDGYYQLGTGFFNEEMTTEESFTRNLNNPKQTPLVTNLDNGTNEANEILILDGTTFRIYRNKELDIVDSFSPTGLTEDRHTNFVTKNMDADDFREIVIYETTADELVHILEFNGTVFTNQTQFNCDIPGVIAREGILECATDKQECMIIVSAFTGIYTSTHACAFNITHTTQSILLHNETNRAECPPLIKRGAYADYDGDGTSEYIFSLIQGSPSVADEIIKIYYLSINSTFNNPILEQTITSTRPGNLYTQSSNPVSECNDESKYSASELPIGKFFTPPLVFDIDGSPSNGLETVVGMMIDDDEFKIISFESDGGELDDYPEIEDADGVIVSNVFRASAFTDTDDDDFCVVGYVDATLTFPSGHLDITCASEVTSETPETAEYLMDLEGRYNITGDPIRWNILSHSGQQSTVTTDGTNLDEIITPYGIVSLDRSAIACGVFGECMADLIWEPPLASQRNGSLITVDVEKVGREDIILITPTNLWYIDDGFSPSGATIDEYFVNPCLDATWKQNTSVEVRITASDPDGDQIRARAILYNNNISVSPQDSGWSALVSSGTTLSFSFIANSTVASDILLLQANDTSNPTEIDEIELTFSVGVNGVEFGECTTEVTIEPEPDIEPPENCGDGTVNADEECDDGNLVSGDGCSNVCAVEDGAIGDEISTVTNTPERFQPLLAGIIILAIMWITVKVLAENNIRDGMGLIYIPIAAGIVTWIILAIPSIGMVPGWTILVGILFAAAFIGFKVHQNRSPGGAGGF